MIVIPIVFIFFKILQILMSFDEKKNKIQFFLLTVLATVFFLIGVGIINSIREICPRKKIQSIDNLVIYSRDLVSHNIKKNNHFCSTRLSCIKNENHLG